MKQSLSCKLSIVSKQPGLSHSAVCRKQANKIEMLTSYCLTVYVYEIAMISAVSRCYHLHGMTTAIAGDGQRSVESRQSF